VLPKGKRTVGQPVQVVHGSGGTDLAPYGETYAIAQTCSFEDD
jgi:hypothetical protein